MSKSLESYINVPTVFALTAIAISIAVWLFYRNQEPLVDTAPELVPLIEQELSATAPSYLFSSQSDDLKQRSEGIADPRFTTQGISLQYSAEKNSILVTVDEIQFQMDSTIQDSIKFPSPEQLLDYANVLIEKQVGKLVENRIRPGINIGVSIKELK